MRAAAKFVEHLKHRNDFTKVAHVRVNLYGSLALTGVGHATDKAVILGLSGYDAATISPDEAEHQFRITQAESTLLLGGERHLRFNIDESIRFLGDIFLPEHPNGMRFCALDAQGIELCSQTWYSVGGGAIASELAKNSAERDLLQEFTDDREFPFSNASELIEHCLTQKMSIADVILHNEKTLFDAATVDEWVASIQTAMMDCLNRGLSTQGGLPGGINIQRRAARMVASLAKHPADDFSAMDWVSIYALAVNEENAGGGRVVTAPTNGSAGVIPAVLAYLENHKKPTALKWQQTFLLTCAAIGWLYKRNASISAAEMGCQGEIGVASSMAAAGMAAILGGTPEQVEHAAEIAMEHHLGMTCDPIAGLVQVPCIERNAFGAVKAIQAARMAVNEPGDHCVSLDECIETMRQTGEDMVSKYKETAQGGLAVNVVVC
jgi:L-serine dehydratase